MDNLTIVIPFYNGHQHIGNLLKDLSRYNFPVIVVDDVSDEPFKPDSKVTSFRLTDKGYFTGACNAGISLCKTDVLILNQDARLSGNEWVNLLDANRSKYAMIGERINGNHPAWPNGYIHGTFMFMRRDALDKVGLMNAALFPLWGSTCEWQVRACRAGFQVLPVQSVPGFKHNRPGRFGSSIDGLLKKQPKLKDLMIRTPPLVSVIVPCYNYGRYLTDLVNSMIGGSTSLGIMPGQSFAAWELIIVDDASDDGKTPGIIASLVDPWKGIRSIRREKRGGTPQANNSGVMASYGRAITVLGADDMMEPTRLEKMYKLWSEDQRRVVYDDNYMFKDGKRVHLFHMREYDFDDLLNKNSMHCGIMYARKAFDEVKGYPIEMTHGREDWAMNVRLGVAGYCGYHLREPLYLYRREGQGRTEKNTTKQWRAAFRAQIEALYPEIYKGKRPDMCCGKKVAKVSAPKPGAKLSSIIGGNGMTMLRYVGKSQGAQTFYGFATGQPYKFGLSRPLGYVDNRDLLGSHTKPGLLDLSENNVKLFAIEKMVEKKITSIIPQAMAAAVDNFKPDTTPQEIIPLEEEQEAAYDLSTMTVAEIRKLAGLTKEQANDLYEQERTNRNRATVIKILSAYL